MDNLQITITTLSGEKVSAPLSQWVSALILRLPPADMTELFKMVKQPDHHQRSNIVLPGPVAVPTVPADPAEFIGRKK